MFDIKWIRENPETFDEGLRKRGLEPLSARLLAIDEERRKVLTSLQEAQSRRNAASKEIGKAKAAKDEAKAAALMAEVNALKSEQESSAVRLDEIQPELQALLLAVPNLPHASVPVGEDESANVEVRRWSPQGGAGSAASPLGFA
ncbi:MAG TPA: serine--tRNA ligase, partial [Hyphomicrobiaceae bacterium]|nr:serine--tRNA ligase [Hyphomicrobiaceae bacterium]